MVILSSIILSAAGIYALMSFTVARSRREIALVMMVVGVLAAFGPARQGIQPTEALREESRQRGRMTITTQT